MTTPSSTLHPCPVCGSKTLDTVGEYEICEVCGWEDDPSQSADPDLEGGANELSLRGAQAAWQKKEKTRAASLKKASPPHKSRATHHKPRASKGK